MRKLLCRLRLHFWFKSDIQTDKDGICHYQCPTCPKQAYWEDFMWPFNQRRSPR